MNSQSPRGSRTAQSSAADQAMHGITKWNDGGRETEKRVVKNSYRQVVAGGKTIRQHLEDVTEATGKPSGLWGSSKAPITNKKAASGKSKNKQQATPAVQQQAPDSKKVNRKVTVYVVGNKLFMKQYSTSGLVGKLFLLKKRKSSDKPETQIIGNKTYYMYDKKTHERPTSVTGLKTKKVVFRPKRRRLMDRLVRETFRASEE